jgi:hypothetical protein
MQDFVRDWRRWTKAERVFAGVIAVLVVAGVPTLLAINSGSERGIDQDVSAPDDAGAASPRDLSWRR